MIALALATAVAVPILPAGDLSGAAVLPGAPGPPSLATGWTVRGGAGFAWPPTAPLRLNDNTTLVSPVVDVPADAQSLSITATARAAYLTVWAEPVAGGAPVALGVITPTPTSSAWRVRAWPVAGQQVRVLLDPVGALGDVVDVRTVDPFAVTLPGWRITAGTVGVPSGRVAVVDDTPLKVESPVVDAGPRATALLVRARGAGRVSGRVGRAAGGAQLTRAWRNVRIPIRAADRRRVQLRLTVDPGGGRVQLSQIGVVVTLPTVSLRRTVRRGPRIVVSGRVVGCAVRAVTVTAPGATRRVRVARDGRFTVPLLTRRSGFITATTAAARLCDPATVRTRAPVPVRR